MVDVIMMCYDPCYLLLETEEVRMLLGERSHYIFSFATRTLLPILSPMVPPTLYLAQLITLAGARDGQCLSLSTFVDK